MGKANGVLCFATLCLLWLLVIRLLSFSGLIIAVISQGATVSAWPCSKMSFGQRAWTSSRMNDCISHYPQCWVCILSSPRTKLKGISQKKKKKGRKKFLLCRRACEISPPQHCCWFTPHLILKWEWKRMKYCLLLLMAGNGDNVMPCSDSELRLRTSRITQWPLPS